MLSFLKLFVVVSSSGLRVIVHIRAEFNQIHFECLLISLYVMKMMKAN